MTMSSSPSGAEPGLIATKGRAAPSSFSQVGTITKYEMLNYFRSRRFFVLLVIDLFISGLITFLVAYYGITTFASTALQFYSFWWPNIVTLVIVLSGIFFGGDAISGEFQNKTGYFLVANPLRRSSIYIGKWLGAFTASLMIFAVFAAIVLGNGIYYFGANVPYQFGLALLFSVFYLMGVLGLTFFFSAFFKTSAMSILVTAILFLFGFGLIELLVARFAGIEPWFIVTYGAGIINNVLYDKYPVNQTNRGIGGREITLYAVSIPEGIAIMLAYFVVTAVLGLILFERREFT